MAAETGLPSAKITTSLPSLTTDPFPIGNSLSSLSSGAPVAAPRAMRMGRAFVLVCGVYEMLQLVLVHWRRNDCVGEASQVRNVERAVVRLAVLTDDASAVGNQFDRQILYADVVDNLVERPLQERGVDRDEGVEAVRRHSRRHADGVLFSNTDIENLVREFGLQFRQSGTLGASPR